MYVWFFSCIWHGHACYLPYSAWCARTNTPTPPSHWALIQIQCFIIICFKNDTQQYSMFCDLNNFVRKVYLRSRACTKADGSTGSILLCASLKPINCFHCGSDTIHHILTTQRRVRPLLQSTYICVQILVHNDSQCMDHTTQVTIDSHYTHSRVRAESLRSVSTQCVILSARLRLF